MFNKELIMEGWYLDKRVSIGHIITTITVTSAVIIWMFGMDSRITVNEVRIQQIAITDALIRSEMQSLGTNIITKLDAIDNKMYEHVKEHTTDNSSK